MTEQIASEAHPPSNLETKTGKANLGVPGMVCRDGCNHNALGPPPLRGVKALGGGTGRDPRNRYDFMQTMGDVVERPRLKLRRLGSAAEPDNFLSMCTFGAKRRSCGRLGALRESVRLRTTFAHKRPKAKKTQTLKAHKYIHTLHLVSCLQRSESRTSDRTQSAARHKRGGK